MTRMETNNLNTTPAPHVQWVKQPPLLSNYLIKTLGLLVLLVQQAQSFKFFDASASNPFTFSNAAGYPDPFYYTYGIWVRGPTGIKLDNVSSKPQVYHTMPYKVMVVDKATGGLDSENKVYESTSTFKGERYWAFYYFRAHYTTLGNPAVAKIILELGRSFDFGETVPANRVEGTGSTYS